MKTSHTKDEHNCDQHIESNMCEAHCRVCGKPDKQSDVRGIEEIVTEFFERNDCIMCYGNEDKQRERLTQTLTHLQEQHEAQLATEKSYINAYGDFVDAMSIDTPFDVAFEELNKKLSEIMDKTN